MDRMLATLGALGWFGSIHLLNRLAPWTLVRWLHAMSLEGMLIPLSMFLLRPTGFFPGRCVGSGGRPILLVHGYCHNCSAWVVLRHRLAKQGLGPIYTVNLTHPFRSIRDYAAQVQAQAEQIERETQRRDLSLIGHSMGGLVSSWYATKLAPAGKVADVITLGSPLHGTYMAKLGVGPNAREMERGSPLIQELQSAMHQSTTRFYHIGTKTDQLIIPSSSAWFGEPTERHFVIEDLGHIGLLFSSRVAKKVGAFLKQS